MVDTEAMGFKSAFSISLVLLAVTGMAHAECPPRVATVLRLLGQSGRGSASVPRSGVEFEFVHPSSLSRRDIAELIAATLRGRGAGYREIQVVRNSRNQDLYVVNFVRPGEELPEQWEVKLDGSIDPGNRALGTEVTTPPMRSAFDRETAWIVLDRLRERGARPNRSTGLHVHVEAKDLGAEGVSAVYLLFAEVEEELAAAFRVLEARRSVQATPIGYAAGDLAARIAAGSVPEIPELIRMSGARKRSLNLHSLRAHGTLEFRIFSGSTGRDYARAAAHFCIELVGAVRRRDPRLVAYLSRLNGRPVDLGGLAEAIGASIPADHPDFIRAALEGLRHTRDTFVDVPTALLGVALLGVLGVGEDGNAEEANP